MMFFVFSVRLLALIRSSQIFVLFQACQRKFVKKIPRNKQDEQE